MPRLCCQNCGYEWNYTGRGTKWGKTPLRQQLLEHFGSEEAVLNASMEELQEVPQVGEKRAREIRQVLHKPKYCTCPRCRFKVNIEKQRVEE